MLALLMSLNMTTAHIPERTRTRDWDSLQDKMSMTHDTPGYLLYHRKWQLISSTIPA